MYNVYLIPKPADLNPASNIVNPLYPNNTNINLDGDSAPNSTGRRLAAGAWPPPTISVTWDSSVCLSAANNNLPTKVGYKEDTTSWKNAIVAALPVDPNSSYKDQAKQMCMAEPLCMLGYAVGSGMVFKKDFWTGAASMTVSMSKAVATSFQETVSISNIKSACTSLKQVTVSKCTYTYMSATCGMNSLPVLKGVTGTGTAATANYDCVPWNTANVRTGALDIAAQCANSCEMLQWYFSWFQNYRVGSYATGSPKPTWDSTTYQYVQDYCGSSIDNWTSYTSAAYYGGPLYRLTG